jgi:hypothetical protein
MLSLNKSPACQAESKVSVVLSFASHNSSNTCIPSVQELPNHSINDMKASLASVSRCVLNSALVIPATVANCSRACHHIPTALVIQFNVFCTAVHPASTLTQVEVKAAPNPRTSCAVNQASFPAGQILCAKSTILLSVVALLFQRSTSVAPRFSNSDQANPKTFCNCAKVVATSSVVRLVATHSLAIVSVKLARSSIGTASCPPSSHIFASSSKLKGISFVNWLNCFLSVSSCSSVQSTVFKTPARASSNDREVLIALITTALNVAIPATARAIGFIIALKLSVMPLPILEAKVSHHSNFLSSPLSSESFFLASFNSIWILILFSGQVAFSCLCSALTSNCALAIEVFRLALSSSILYSDMIASVFTAIRFYLNYLKSLTLLSIFPFFSSPLDLSLSSTYRFFVVILCFARCNYRLCRPSNTGTPPLCSCVIDSVVLVKAPYI